MNNNNNTYVCLQGLMENDVCYHNDESTSS